MTLPSVSLDTSKRRPHPTQQTCPPSSAVLQLPRPSDVCILVFGCIAGTTVLHDAVSVPNVMCLHRLSDLTPTACPTDSMP